jgi:hypothetical protein
MKLNLLGLTVATVVLSAVYSGCGGVEHKTGSDSKVGSATKSLLPEDTTVTFAAKPKKKVILDIDNGACTATFDEHPNGTLRKGTLRITAGAGTSAGTCQSQPEETDGPQSLTINGKTVVDIGPVQFTTEGSCRYCYVNSSGGMSCVVYNVPSCPR